MTTTQRTRWSAIPVVGWTGLRVLLARLAAVLNGPVAYKDEWRHVFPGSGSPKHVAIDAAGAHVIFVEVGGVAPDIVIDNPTNGTPGQELEIQLFWTASGGGTLVFGTAYAMGSALPPPTISPKIVRSITFTKRGYGGVAGVGVWGEKCRSESAQPLDN